MSEAVHTETYQGHQIEIFPDSDATSPRDWDNLGTMNCWHRRYDLGDKHSHSDPRDLLIELAELNSDTDLSMSALLDSAQNKAVILPLYLYDHSGITMNTMGFHCPWDSGQVGYIYAGLDDIRKEHQITRVSQKIRTQIAKQLTQEVATYDDFLTGNCYGFVVKKDDEEISSCWGFLGDYEPYCLVEARAAVI